MTSPSMALSIPETLRSIKKFSIIAVILASTLTATGCAEASDTTKEQGKAVICTAASGVAGQIRTGGAIGKLLAGVVRDNSDGEIKTLAEKVADGTGDEKSAQELARYVEKICGLQ